MNSLIFLLANGILLAIMLIILLLVSNGQGPEKGQKNRTSIKDDIKKIKEQISKA